MTVSTPHVERRSQDSGLYGSDNLRFCFTPRFYATIPYGFASCHMYNVTSQGLDVQDRPDLDRECPHGE